ncbi:MAG: hypothetical protein ACQEWV_18120 [Bacillota bacterium]
MKLTGEMNKLLMMCGSAMIIFVYIGIFVNLYIWERNHDLFDVAWYNIWMCFSAALFYSFATRQLMIRSIQKIVRLSAYFGAGSFLLLSGFRPDNELIGIIMYALPIGAMMGCYWGGMNIMLSVYGKGKEFVTFFSVFAIVGQVISISVPLLSAAIRWTYFAHYFQHLHNFRAILCQYDYLFRSIFCTPIREYIQKG